MNDPSDIDNLIDNFDLVTFWNKRDLKKILAVYGVYLAIGTIGLVRAVLNSSDAGAVPKGLNISGDTKTSYVR